MKSLLNFAENNFHLHEGDFQPGDTTIIQLWKTHQFETNSRMLVEAENNLRFAIGRYIHDNPQQQLQAAISLLQEQTELLQHDPQQAITQVAEINRRILELLNQADSELSMVRREVLPADPRAGTLLMSLETYIIEDFPRLHPDQTFEISYRLDELTKIFDCPKSQTSEKMLISLFVREALKNTYKHSEATQVEIESKIIRHSQPGGKSTWRNCLPDEGYYLRLSVKDNGVGFDLAALQQSPEHSSFYDFEARVSMLGGFSRVASAPGHGTLWEIYLPLSNIY